MGQLFSGGGIRVWNEVYASQSPPPPVSRDDPRWQRCGVAVRRPRYADLERVYNILSHAEIFESPDTPLQDDLKTSRQ